ncbi:MAG: hypothetical protein H7145_07660 [Akkermansiaceae bacterium]|nr:hypothetical protein [Armatimonadota bacterium]
MPTAKKIAVTPAPKRLECDLSAPVTEFLAAQGYTVRAEVKNCDITATRDDFLTVVELKTAFSIDLLIQAVERQTIADAVYVGLPAEGTFARSSRYDKRRRGIEALLKRLQIGLILVHFAPEPDIPPRVEVSLDPVTEAKPKPRPRKRQTILREIAGRSGDYNVGGTTGVKRTTAYREQAIFLAACLEAHGNSSPAQLCVHGATRKAGDMLFKNVYGWFVREGRGVYALSPDAIAEMERDWLPALTFQRARVAAFAAR